MQIQLQLHYITQHYTTLFLLHYTATATTTTTTLHYTTLITLHYSYSSTTLHLQLRYTTSIIPLHYNYNSTTLQLQVQLHYTTLHPAVVVRWPLQPLQRLQKHNSNHLLFHLWIRSAICDSQQPTSPIGFLSLKLPPPSCTVLLVIIYTTQYTDSFVWIFTFV